MMGLKAKPLGLLFCCLLGVFSWIAPAPLPGEALFFVQAMPAFSLTSVAPLSDTLSLSPEDYARYYDFPSVLNLGLELHAARSEIVFRVDIRPDFQSFATERYYGNLPFIAHGINSIGDANMPTVGYFEFGGEKLLLSIGRRQLKWGPGSYGLAISDSAPYLDHLWIDYRFPTRRGEWWYGFVAIGADRAGNVWTQLDPEPAGWGYKNIFAHRVGYASDRLRIAVGELNLIHDIVPGLIDISPFAVYHNMYQDAYSNVMLDASAEIRFGTFRTFGEMVMDDLVMPWETSDGSPARPTALGFLGGAEWKIAGGAPYAFGRMREADYSLRENSFSEPGGLRLSYEGYRTTTYLYNRENDSGKWTLPDHRLVNTSTGYLYTANAFYLGFPYGPDTILDMLKLSWENPSLKADLSLKYLRKGSYGIESAYPPSNGAATWFDLQEPVTRNLIVGVGVEAVLSPAIEVWGKGECWFGDSPQASLTGGLAYRYSTR